MAENKYLNYAGLKKYDELIKALMNSKDAENLDAAKAYADDLAENYEAAGAVATAKAELQAKIDENKAGLDKLNGDATTEGSVDKKVADAKSELNTAISNVDKKVDATQAEVDAVEGEVTRVEAKVDANANAIGDLETLETTSKEDLVKAINEVRNAVSVGGTAAAITMTSDTTIEGMLKSYTIKQGENVVGTIDIPKDMVVQSGEVVVLAENEVAGYAAGTYIKLTLANATNDVIYVNVGTLVDIYKAKANATQVQLTIDSATREISAVIVAESITATELAADAVTTVKIADGNVTKAKLSTAVQASLDKADAAATKAEFDDEVARAKAAEEKALTDAKAYADEKVLAEENRAKGVESGLDERLQAVETALGDGEGSVGDQIADAKAEAIAAAAEDATTKANTAESNAKAHADAEIAKTNANVAQNASDIDALEASLAEGGATANAIASAESNAKAHAESYADGLNDAMNERVEALENADTYVEITTAEVEALFSTNA